MRRAWRASWGSVTVVWRSLTWKEVRRLSAISADYVRASEAYRIALLQGPPLDRVPAGIPSWIGRFLLEQSGFSGRYDLVQQRRAEAKAWCEDYLNSGRALVAWAFGYKFEEMDEWDEETFFRRLAQAEFIFGREFSPVDPSAPPPAPQETGPPRQTGRRKFSAPRPSDNKYLGPIS